ncbi:serine protease inhibitor I/II-like [Homalodisca vitripennis]|uniref:serine protease inhibitor I/II-like n=1 Tax=Homalodisca vitripennis TaxID=197043 RepID=UPI001EEA8FCC|nr:serine protease inhibitor I/II-like [Homalodisca vitripennis]
MKSSYLLLFSLCLLTVLHKGNADLNVVKQNTCEPGTTFQRDCNTCRCRPDGTVGGCTRRFCNPPVTLQP